jgi:hypothetical protein
VDEDGNGKWDQDYIGSPHPKWIYGAGLDLTHEGGYGGLDLRVFVQGSQGNKLYNASRTFTNSSTCYLNQERRMLNRWNGEGSTNDASLPRMNSRDMFNTDQLSDVYVEDGSYLRIKDLQLGYSLPKSLMKSHTIRIFVGVQNLFTFTNYTGLDPEIGLNPTRNDLLDIGIDRGTYPQARTLYSGINVSL